MRSILLELGPWEWPAVFVIMAVLVVIMLLWRRAEAVLGEQPPPPDARWLAITGLFIAVVSVVLLLVVNRFGPIKVRSWGTMLLVGFAVAAYYVWRIGEPRGLSFTMLMDMVILQLALAIIGARVVHIVLEFDQFESPAEIFALWSGGLSFHGGLLGAVIATVVFARWRNIRFAVLADLCTLGIPIGYSLTRIGCFLNGCCYGRPTDLPWGVVMPETGRPEPLHPTQLYASAGSLIVFGILRWSWPRLRRPGQLFPLYMILYSILRFLCEFTRYGVTGDPFPPLPSFTVAQVACVVIAAFGLVLLALLQRLPAEDPVAATLTTRADKEADGSNARPGNRHR